MNELLELMSLMPHPPIALSSVGGSETKKIKATVDAMETMAENIVQIDPETILAITPHGHVFTDAVTITSLGTFFGDMSRFGAPQEKLSFDFDAAGADAIIEKCRQSSFPCFMLDEKGLNQYNCSQKLDHGLVVPLSFIYKKGWRGKIIPVNVAMLPFEELYLFGHLLREALDSLEKKWVLLASSDLSHRLTYSAPAGYAPEGAIFDEYIKEKLRLGDTQAILNADREMVEKAGECGLRSIIIGLGALDGFSWEAHILSYEGPFGVGYMVASIKPEEKKKSILIREKEPQEESLPVKLARETIEYYLSKRSLPKLDEIYTSMVNEKAGAFVSLKKYGRLRGCIGTIEPQRDNVGLEIIYNAVAAAQQDPRFDPVEKNELDQLEITVDVLGEPEPVNSEEELDPDVYGVIVTKGARRGLLLPDIEGVHTAAEQIAIALQKAGIKSDEDYSLERFRVTRYR